MLHICNKKLVRVNVLTDAKKLLSMKMHVAELFIIMSQKASIRENKLEAVVEQAWFV